GFAVVQELIGAGHEVLGLARSDAAAQKLTDAGAEVHRGSLEDHDCLRRGVAASEGVIHTAFNFYDFANSTKVDLEAIEILGAALAGSGRPFIITTGLMALKSSPGLHTEGDAEGDPSSPFAARMPSEAAALSW